MRLGERLMFRVYVAKIRKPACALIVKLRKRGI